MPEPIAHVHRIGLERYMRTGHGLIVDAGTPVAMPARTKNDEGLRVELSLSELRNSRGERFALAVIRDAMHKKHLELTNLELAQARVARSEAQAELAARDDLLESVAATLQAEPKPDELRRLASALADFSRVHGGELRVRPRDADLVDLVHAVADAVRRRATGRRLLVHAPPAVPANRQGEDAAARAPEGRSPGRAGEEAEKRSSEGLLLRLALIQLLTNSISSIVGPLVLVLGGYLLLRRWRAEGQPLAPAGVMTPGPATAPGSPDRQEPPLTFDPGTEALAGPEE